LLDFIGCLSITAIEDANSLCRWLQTAQHWGFVFTIAESSLQLHRQPFFLGQVLTAEDLIEYIATLSGIRESESDATVSSHHFPGDGSTSAAVDVSDASTIAPPAIRRILNSKACRHAIMFGDKLSHAECQKLLRRLSTCRNPFQCAHGRPSAVPLVLLPK